MRTLAAGAAAAIAAPVTEPGYLIEILFTTPLRLSTRGAVTWSGNSWQPWLVKVTLDEHGGMLVLGNSDLTLSALVLGEGVANRPVNIWKLYGSTPAAADPVQIFAGVADGVEIYPSGGDVTMQLVKANTNALFAPRLYCTPEQGFNFLPAPGTVIDWDGERYILEAER